MYLTRIYLRYSSHTHTLSAIFNVHSVKEYTHTHTHSHPLNISECEENHPADTRNLHLACLIHIHVIEGYRCVCWLTCSLSLTFPPFFHSSIDFLFCQEHGWSLNRWQGTARTFFLHSLSSFFSYSRSPSLVFPPHSLRLATSFGSQRQEKWRRQTWQQNAAKLPCPHSLAQQPRLPLQWAFIKYQDSKNNSSGMKLTQFLIEKRFV